MPDKFTHTEAAIAMGTTGLLIGLGQLLASEEKLSVRIVVGRALSSTGLALASGAVLIEIPEVPLLALVGISALIASLGTSFLENFLNKWFGGYPK